MFANQYQIPLPTFRLTKECNNPCCEKIVRITVDYCSTNCVAVIDAIKIIEEAIRVGRLSRGYVMERIEDVQ